MSQARSICHHEQACPSPPELIQTALLTDKGPCRPVDRSCGWWYRLQRGTLSRNARRHYISTSVRSSPKTKRLRMTLPPPHIPPSYLPCTAEGIEYPNRVANRENYRRELNSRLAALGIRSSGLEHDESEWLISRSTSCQARYRQRGEAVRVNVGLSAGRRSRSQPWQVTPAVLVKFAKLAKQLNVAKLELTGQMLAVVLPGPKSYLFPN
ncbi:hypothetical protein F5Y15DRAFT_368071 [Xylariaceae sp. FL0016]|nr:hypothetical protein F5Y15DRAFT_368071 [Xylariaceae sp. FL0016]